MSKVLSILLSTLVLIQSVNLSFDYILHLDELVEHAQFHKKEYGDNFFVFISKHYGDLKAEHNEKHQEEQKDHEQLPFHCQGHTMTFSALVFLDTFIESDSFELTEWDEANFYYQSSRSSLHKKGLLQPPKHS